MKKRLLSAALALALVLTMLPLAALPAFAAAPELASDKLDPTGADTSKPKTVSVTYRAQGYQFQAANATTGAEAITAPNDGWFYWGNAFSTETPKKNELYEVKSGVIIGTGTSGNWYSSANDALEYGKAASIKLIDNVTDLDLTKATGTSLIIDVNGKSLAFASGKTLNNLKDDTNTDPTKLTGLTINNSGDKTAATVSGPIAVKNQAFSFTASNIAGSGAPTITLTNETTTARTLTVKLTDSKVGDISVTGGAANVTVIASTKGAAETGAIKVNETAPTDDFDDGSTTINVKGGKTGDIVINGKGTITLDDMAEVGTITLSGGSVDETLKRLKRWGGAFTVTVGSQCVTGAISEASGNAAVITVNANGGSGSTTGIASINFNTSAAIAHKVTINGAKVGTIAMNAGTLTVSNGANVGAVTLGNSDPKLTGTVTATISGSATQVAGVDGEKAGDITLNISGGTINGDVKLKTTYAKHTISGGSFKNQIQYTGWLSTSLLYEIKGSASDALYTYTSSFQDCVNAYKNDKGATIQPIGAVATYAVKFYLDAPDNKPDAVLEMKTDANHAITLPSSVNNKSIATWYINDRSYDAGALIQINDATEIYATVGSADNSEIVKVTADYSTNKNTTLPGLSATLSGTTIKVSGALPATSSGIVPIDLLVETALGNKYQIKVSYSVAEKKLIANETSMANTPFTSSSSNTSIQVTGTSLYYALDGSGLMVSNGSVLEIKDENLKGQTNTVANVTVGGTAEKAALKTNLETVTADFSGSAAIKEAANKVVASLSENTVNNYIRNARIKAWQADNNKSSGYTESDLSAYGSTFNSVKVEVYLYITTKSWDRTSNSQSLLLDIKPYYRLVVTDTNGDISNNKAGGAYAESVYVAKAGAALPTDVTGEYGKVVITLGEAVVGANGSVGSAEWVHHGTSYVYPIDNYAFTTTHGFSDFLINRVDPVAGIIKENARGNYTGAKADFEVFYDNVQTAIDDTVDGDVVVLYTKYSKTAETYSFSGKARTITFDPGINGTFTPTFSGASVTADKTNGNVWTVQLNSDTVVSTAHISLGSYTNGTASLSTTNAVQGSTVTVTTTPNTGYRSLTPTVTANTGSVSVTGSDGTYTFTVPNGATSITVTPAFVLGDVPFTDVAENAWYYDGVSYCYNTFAGSSRLMQGVENNRFGVNSTMTRAQIVEIMWRMAGSPVETQKIYFSDVPSGQWYSNSIAWAANHGIVEGYENGTFQPNRNISRQELAQMLWKFADRPNVSINLAASYPDGASVSPWAQSAMQWAAGRGILSGRSSVALTRLDATATAYRSELAVTIMKYHQYHG